ncbi:MAG TPA: alpha-glucan family phosphorylase [Bryobacteraceae bacterium]|jgi:starch phosphorylase|nr:alpha-glucan family phosphorylase [Bryobacteraceae bacterium]
MSNLKYTNLPAEASNEDALAQLALDLSWPGRHATGVLWERLNPELWEMTHSPWAVLQTVSTKRLEEITSDPVFQKALAQQTQARGAAAESSWFHRAHPGSPLSAAAYFSMEYMLSEALPIYSGGLGNVAGDQLKAANDLGVPVTGVGLLYDQGYFRQEIDRNGSQRALYPYNAPGQLPIRPVRDADGEWVRLSIPFPGCKLWIRTWEVQVGRARLYLLDTNDPANVPEYRSITGELYGGGPDLRLRQEHVLGIAGWRLLRLLGIRPEVCHLNEGHAAFAVLERAASYMEDTGHPFDVALTVTRAGNLFTTHTAVEAGFDRFPADLMYTHFGDYCGRRLRIPFDQLLALGRRNGDDGREPFNMAYLALRGCGAVNGVSRLHGAVSRQLFQPLFPRWPADEVPVGHVTNGVHVPTWDSTDAHELWAEVCGSRCWRGDLDQIETQIRGAGDAAVWRMRNDSRKALIEYVRRRYARQVAIQGGSDGEIAAAGEVLDVNTLTIGFARRFATYKRPNLLLRDPSRLLRILGNSQRPVQLIVAGKAHPQDIPGQDMVRQWIEFIRSLGTRPPVIFLSDYDMLLTERLVGGIDVWLNTPRRPWEACGTSGMKVLVNGGLNLSEIDGWWAEAYTPECGWAIGDGREHGDDPAWDTAEAEALYTMIEQQVVPEFYQRDSDGIPPHWAARMRESMAQLTPAYSANRTVREYTEDHYLPGAAAYSARAAENGKLGMDVLDWQRKLSAGWTHLAFGPLKVESHGGRHSFEVVVYLGGIEPDGLLVEMFADGHNGEQPKRTTMNRVTESSDGGFVYAATVESGRDANDFTPRVIPYHQGVSVPLEASQILWQR